MFIHLHESSEKNKQNRHKVKYHQATGSRSYVAHLHAYVSKEYLVHCWRFLSAKFNHQLNMEKDQYAPNI